MRNCFSIVCLLTFLSCLGCSTAPGVFNGMSEDPMRMLIIFRTDGQPITEWQYKQIAEIASRAKGQVDPQISSSAESAVSSGIPYGLAGAAGGAFEGPIGAAAGGTIGFLGGAITGIYGFSYSEVWLVADVVEQTLRYREKAGEAEFKNLHISASFVRTRNSSTAPAPGLIQSSSSEN